MTSFAPLARPTLTGDLVCRITQLIQQERYEPGHPLPPIAAMARAFGVSRPTLREALRQLQASGVVDIRHGAGVFVKSASPLLVPALSPCDATSKALLLDLMQARIPLELATARLAARRATTSSLATLQDSLADAESKLGDPALAGAANVRYHVAIAAASGNAVLSELVRSLSGLLEQEQRMTRAVRAPSLHNHRDHVRIFEALEQRDAALAVSRMRAHLVGARRAVMRWDPETAPVV